MHFPTGDGGEVREALAEFARHEIDVLAINGGDGTVARVLGEVLEHQPFPGRLPVALLPGGTANMSADRLGVRGSLTRAARRLFDWSAGRHRGTCETLSRPILRVRFADGRDNAYGMFLGAGAVVHGTEYAHREIHARGLRDDFSLFLGTLRTAWGVVRGEEAFTAPTRLGLSLDGHAAGAADTLILAVSTLDRLAFGMRPFWGTGAGPLRVTLIEQHAPRFLPTFLSIIAGRPSRRARAGGHYRSHNARELELALAGELNLDGELLTVAQRARLTASPPLVFLRP